MEIKLKQRIIGIVVLGALAVIFIPLFFKGYNQPTMQQNAVQQIPNPPPPPTPPNNIQTSHASSTTQLAYDNSGSTQPAANAQLTSMTPSASTDATPVSPTNSINPTNSGTTTIKPNANPKNNSPGVVTSKNQVVNTNSTLADAGATDASVSNSTNSAMTTANTGSAVQYSTPAARLTADQQSKLDALNKQLDSALASTTTKKSSNKIAVNHANPNSSAMKASGLKSYAIQVGTFANTQNADKLMKQLETHGYKTFSTNISTAKGKMVRVLVGPIDQSAKAKTTMAKLDQELHLKGNLISPTI